MYLYNSLNSLKADGPNSPSCGICSNVFFSLVGKTTHVEEYGNILKVFIEDWCNSNEVVNTDYPIEGNRCSYISNEAKWNKRTKYGKLRYKLLDYLIKRAKEENV